MTAGALPPLALLAGGTATRLRPITERIAKSMVDIGGTPFIDYQLRLIRSEGIHRVVICCGFLHEQIESHVGDGRRYGLSVAYSHDGDTQLGTGGALRKALPLLGPEFLVMYGDSYLDIRFAPVVETFQRSGAQGLMTILRNANRWDTSNVLLRDGMIVAYDKVHRTPDMAHIDFGLGCLKRTALQDWPADSPFDLVGVYQKLVSQSQLVAYEVVTRFYEIGSHDGLAETTDFLLKLPPPPAASSTRER